MSKEIQFKTEKYGYCGTCWYTFTKEDFDNDQCEKCPSCELDKEHTYTCKKCGSEFVDLNDELDTCEDCSD